MKKKVINKFGEHYLLGKGIDGQYYYLEKESWDCGWYWGLGYIHTFTNNKAPQLSRDIASHQHFDGLFLNGTKCAYDNFIDFFEDIVLTDKELWTFIELMKTAYTLKESAEVFGRGGSHFTTNPCADVIKNTEIVDKINNEMIPAIMDKVRELLV